MIEIIFWNTERLSDTVVLKSEKYSKAAEIADKIASEQASKLGINQLSQLTEKIKKEMVLEEEHGHENFFLDGDDSEDENEPRIFSKKIFKELYKLNHKIKKERRESKKYKTESLIKFEKTYNIIRGREEKKLIAKINNSDRANYSKDIYAAKCHYARSLRNNAGYVFFCECVMGYEDYQDTTPSALRKQQEKNKIKTNNLGYSCYKNGEAIKLNRLKLPDFIEKKLIRIPMFLSIDNIDFIFWHATASTDKQVVFSFIESLNQRKEKFVLFGDLNIAPEILQSLYNGSIISPSEPTRISGNIIDYAISNITDGSLSCTPYLNVEDEKEIKRVTGSDHMIMRLTYNDNRRRSPRNKK